MINFAWTMLKGLGNILKWVWREFLEAIVEHIITAIFTAFF